MSVQPGPAVAALLSASSIVVALLLSALINTLLAAGRRAAPLLPLGRGHIFASKAIHKPTSYNADKAVEYISCRTNEADARHCNRTTLVQIRKQAPAVLTDCDKHENDDKVWSRLQRSSQYFQRHVVPPRLTNLCPAVSASF